MEGFIAVCATAKRWEALVPNKRANNGLAGDTYANEGVPRELSQLATQTGEATVKKSWQLLVL
jgi:hypothetical protein